LTVITDQNAKRSVSGEWLASAALLGAVLTIGLATVHDVGITIDEFLFDGYGALRSMNSSLTATDRRRWPGI